MGSEPSGKKEMKMHFKKMTALFAAAAAFTMASAAFAADYSVKPLVTDLKAAPERVLLVGNSFMYYNCGINGYLSVNSQESVNRV